MFVEHLHDLISFIPQHREGGDTVLIFFKWEKLKLREV